MQLNPRYGTDPIIVLDGVPGDVGAAAIRQRRRLVGLLGDLAEEEWSHPSRCEGWSVRDVIVHLDTTNAFWSFSIGAGLRGDPSRFLATFDPVASPAALVAGAGEPSSAEVLEGFAASTAALCDRWASLDDDEWATIAEAPPGHVAIDALAHHALWDSWVHERDVLAPLGRPMAEEPDEVRACLRYVAALSPAFALTLDPARSGTLGVVASDPATCVEVAVEGCASVRSVDEADASTADLVVRGPAVDLVESLSLRRPLPTPSGDATWLLDGLATVFDAVDPST